MLDMGHHERTGRRRFLAHAASAALSISGLPGVVPLIADDDASDHEVTETSIRDYLLPLLPTHEDVDQWMAGKAFPFSRYDAELGYLHRDRDFQEGQDGAICQYRYDPQGARRMFVHADRACRINSYGDSFTSCEQVCDGETWQEALAAHLGEPVRNYGIGGYSVYQAYLRMLREDQRAPAQYIIFNIFDDDHVRNLMGWQRFKFGVNRKSINPTVPHVTVDFRSGRITDRPNPCPTAQSVHDLCDPERAYGMFHNDFYLHNRLLRAAQKNKGLTIPPTDYDDQRLIRHGIVATIQIVGRINDFANEHGKRVLYILSYGAYTIKKFMETGTRFDQTLVNHLNDATLPYVDLMRAHTMDAARFKGTPDEALSRYFIGHYNALGNHFCAFAMKDGLVRLLDPKPPTYRTSDHFDFGRR
jgi:hypothetical protein